MMIIDGENLVLGRLASCAAKEALANEKEEYSIINAEKVVVSGSKTAIIKRYKFLVEVGDIYKGPFIPRMPDRLLRKTIKGMLPMNRTKGREAFRRVMAYVGSPESLKGKMVDAKLLKKFHKINLKDQKYMMLKDVSEQIGMKIKKE